jgi:DNA invertase Pin-like site-specific DNA recombinase
MATKKVVTTKPGLKAAIYVRVSTADQKNEMQLTELGEYAARMGWQTVIYSDKTSGTKAKRPGLDALMADARARKFDVVIVYKLDRFARSLQHLITNIQLLDTFGVRFVCVTQGIDTDRNNPASRLMLHILGAVAEFERGIIVERVKSGVAEAQRQGKHCGRSKRVFRRDLAERLRKQGLSLRAIGLKLGVPFSTIADALKPVRKG